MANRGNVQRTIVERFYHAGTAGFIDLGKELPLWATEVLETLILDGDVTDEAEFERFLEVSGLVGAGRSPGLVGQRLHGLAKAGLIEFDKTSSHVAVTSEGLAHGTPAQADAKLNRWRRQRLIQLLKKQPGQRMIDQKAELLRRLRADLPRTDWANNSEILEYLLEYAAEGWLIVGHPRHEGKPDKTKLVVKLKQ
jgi:hypothetical protein